ncbi:hypothetical protein Tco_0645940 [Tanacetum coccineum]
MSNQNTTLSQALIPIFKGEKYCLWSLKMSNLFKSQELWELVKNGFPDPKPAEPDQALRDNRNRKVITVKLQTLHREFEILKMKDEESVQDYLSRVSTIMNQMKSYGENVTDEVIVSKVLRSLSSNFDHLVAAIEEFKDLLVYTFDELMSSLLAHEDRIGSLGPSDFWFIDNGSSSHMSRSGSLFVNLDISKKLMVRLGDDIQVQVEGKVSIDIDTTTGKNKVLHDVLFVPKLAHNLLSIGQLMSSGLVIVFDDGYCYIQDKRSGQRIAKVGMTTNKMFPLDVSSVKEKAMVVKAWKDSNIWHLGVSNGLTRPEPDKAL